MLFQPCKTFVFGTQMKIFLIKFERWITTTEAPKGSKLKGWAVKFRYIWGNPIVVSVGLS